jgi:hypothetical protein
VTYSSDDPTLVTYPLARSSYEYIMRLKELGAIEGALGSMTVMPELQPIVDAIHTVLAGGAVKIEVTQRPNPDIVRELNDMLAQGQKDANYINEKSGYYVTIAAP